MPRKRMTILLILACAGACLGDDKDGIHLTGNAAPPSLNVNDGANYRWDITSAGMVNDGSSDAYDGGMQLTINNNTFGGSGSAKISADGREIEIGPYNNGQVNIFRRIYVDPKKGYCRWIDIFENNSANAVTLNIQYYTNTGGSTRQVYSSAGKDAVTDKDWGVVTGFGPNASNPAIVHVMASKSSKLKPRFKYQMNDDSTYYNLAIAVPARKAAALCFFQAQCKTYADAKKFLDDFSTSSELEKVPAALRKIILNMSSGSTMMLGKIELLRNEKQDLAVLRNGDELLGDLEVERFELDTVFGKITLAPARVIGLICPDADDPTVQAALADGQVVVGKLLSEPLKMKLPNGGEMSLSPDKFSTVSYRLSKEKPDEIAGRNPAVVLRSGQQLFFDKSGGDYAFQSEYGEIKLSPDDLASLMLDTPDGGLHRAMFRNGSVLSGMLKAPGQKLDLDLGVPLAVATSAIERFIFPSEDRDNDKLVEVTLRNEDQLYGAILDESLTVQSTSGKAVITPREISEIQFMNEVMGVVQIKLHSGATISGRLTAQTLRFKIEPGPELAIFVGHITRIGNPVPDTAATGQSPATSATKPSRSTKPATRATTTASVAEAAMEEESKADALAKENELMARDAAARKRAQMEADLARQRAIMEQERLKAK